MRRSDFLTPLTPPFVSFGQRLPARASVFECSAVRRTTASRELCGLAAPSQILSDWRRQDLPSSWGTLVCLCPVLRPRQDRRTWPGAVHRHGPRYEYGEGYPHWCFRGSIARPWHSLSSLRPPDHSGGRPTRFPSLARRYGAGLDTRRVPTEGFRDVPTSLPPSPSSTWRKFVPPRVGCVGCGSVE